MTQLATVPAPKPRISAKVRRALELRVREGLSIRAAAQGAGMSEQGFHKALKRPAVKDELQAMQARFVAEVEASRSLYKARAFEVALDLMMNAKSETVRARMAEFLATDGKPGTSVSVHVDASQTFRGYEYVPPGARVVEIGRGEDTPVTP